jgi:hypothetical protein
MSSRVFALLCLFGITVSAWSAENDNRSFAEADPKRYVTVGPNDTIIPHIADGDSWQTTIVLTNLVSTPVFYGMDLKSDNGGFQAFDIVGTGRASSFIGTIPVGATIYISTAGTSSTLTQGWGKIAFYDRPPTQPGAQFVTTRAGGFAIFRRRLPGLPDQEAVVPISNNTDTSFTVVFDNRDGFLTGVAFLNPTGQAGILRVIARDNAGNVLFSQVEGGLSPGVKDAFLVRDLYPTLAGKAGTLTYFTTGNDGTTPAGGVVGVGLRFNPTGSFTSTYPLRLQ